MTDVSKYTDETRSHLGKIGLELENSERDMQLAFQAHRQVMWPAAPYPIPRILSYLPSYRLLWLATQNPILSPPLYLLFFFLHHLLLLSPSPPSSLFEKKIHSSSPIQTYPGMLPLILSVVCFRVPTPQYRPWC
jgi:hypothetical protein